MDVSLLDPELREMIGDMRGEDPPRVDILRRLRDINPNFRITYTHPTPDRVVGGREYQGRPGLFWLHEVRPNNPHDRMRAAAGAARLERYNKFSEDRQQRNLGIPAQCADMMAGYWPVGSWPKYTYIDEVTGVDVVPFGSEAFFREVIQGEIAFREEKKRVEKEAALDMTADEEILSEMESNDTYRQAALEDWALIFAGRHSVHGDGAHGIETPATSKEKTNAGTDRQQVERPGQGLEPGRHEEAARRVG